MKLIKRVALLSVVLSLNALQGCGSNVHELAEKNQHSLSSYLIKGKTTTADVKNLLGNPSNVDFDQNANQKWTYQEVSLYSRAVNFVPAGTGPGVKPFEPMQKLVILFNKKERIKDFVLSDNIPARAFAIK